MKNYFLPVELECPCCKQCLLMEGFLDKLNELREALGNPMVVNSCCRCVRHNAAIGGAHKSFHLINAQLVTGLTGACAADISTLMWPDAKRAKFLKLAREMGWSIGHGASFIHIDRRVDHGHSITEWHY
ncbi:D-Ala-D-Ala carboxypeptidase family metallohydrolase [Tundrisphaera lichenicola]|uniref:D-Ala-D-Ala carboxypeptidase family metallohydrolase n=1 Tax=Tundrisphaera lichenicola TaxID=2029860 RepID=UPI003EBDE419